MIEKKLKSKFKRYPIEWNWINAEKRENVIIIVRTNKYNFLGPIANLRNIPYFSNHEEKHNLRRHGPTHRQDGDQQGRDHGRQVCDHLLRARPAGQRAGGNFPHL